MRGQEFDSKPEPLALRWRYACREYVADPIKYSRHCLHVTLEPSVRQPGR